MRKLLVIEDKRGPEWIVDEGERNFRAFRGPTGAYHTINRRGTFRQTCLNLVGGKPSKLITPILNPGEFHPRVWRPHCYPVMREFFETGWLSAMHAARSLMANMTEVFRYAEPHPSNLKVFSHQIRQLLILACTEVEAQCKATLRANSYVKLDTNGKPAVHKGGKLKGHPKDWDMRDFMKLRNGARHDEWTVQLVGYPSMPRTRPFAAWRTGKSPAWYRAYNKVKHDRELHFEHATLGHLIEALGAVLSDNYISPATTTTSPHPWRRDSSAGRRPSTGWRGRPLATGERRSGEEADGRDAKARPCRRSRDEGRDGSEDGEEVRAGREATVGDGGPARLADARGSVR